jgi:hypothetical protein
MGRFPPLLWHNIKDIMLCLGLRKQWELRQYIGGQQIDTLIVVFPPKLWLKMSPMG